jgi:iron transport multicopper oxidase
MNVVVCLLAFIGAYPNTTLYARGPEGHTVYVEWNVEWVYGVNPDGAYPRRAIGINNKWPPPTVILKYLIIDSC